MIEIYKGLIWQGDLNDAESVSKDYLWESIGIRAILSVGVVRAKNLPSCVPFLSLPISESEVTHWSHFELAREFHQTFGGTLVHCNAGQNRSRVFAAALLIARGHSLNDAIKICNPPPGPVLDGLANWMKWMSGT